MKDPQYPADDGLSPADLMRYSVQLYSEYDGSKMTVDNHSDEWLEQHKIFKEEDREFLHQVFYGCIRYKELIKPLVSTLFTVSSAHILRSDSTLYYVVSYLTLIRLVDLTFRGYRMLILSQAPEKMLPFLLYMFRDKGWKQWCPLQWAKFYDKNYVESLIDKCEAFEADAEVLIAVLERRVNFHKISLEQKEAFAAASGTEPTRKVTTAKPFNLSQNKAKPQEYMKHEPVVYVAKPAPPVQVGPTIEELNLEKMRDENKRKSLRKLEDANKNAFVPMVLQRRDNIEAVRAEVMSMRDKELKFDGIKANPVPNFEKFNDIKLNYSTVIREDYTNKKKIEEEIERRREFERNLRDSTEFEMWQRRCREEDEALRQKEIQDRIEEVSIAAEAAREAKEKDALKIKKNARTMREELQKHRIERQIQNEKALESKRETYSKVVNDRNLVQNSIDKMTAQRRAKAEIVALERAIAVRQIQEMRDIEREKKVTIIKELQEAKKSASKHQTPFDPTSTVDAGLLNEMSLADLRERLKAVQQEKEEEIKMKKEAVKSTLAKKSKLMKEATNRVLKMRRLRAAQAYGKAAEKKIETSQKIAPI